MKVIIALIFLLLPILTFSQKYHKRKNGETIDQFVARHFPYEYAHLDYMVLAEEWGDTSKGEKILFFYLDSIDSNISMKVLQLSGHRKYCDMRCEYGSFSDSQNMRVTGVFYYDFEDDGVKELVVLEKGDIPCQMEIDETDPETGERIYYFATTMCEFCYAVAFHQPKNNSGFEDKIQDMTLDNMAFECEQFNEKHIRIHLDDRKNYE